MTDTANLVLAVDATQVKAGAVSLDSLAASGARAEAATDKLSGAARNNESETARASATTRTFSSGLSTLAAAATAAATAFGLWKIVDFVRDSAMLSARFETMGIVMGVAGNNAGYTRAQMDALATSLQKSGISMLASRSALTTLATAHIDLANATKIARAAQDLAVVGGINSSAAFERMVQGIQSGQTVILSTMGLNVNFEQSYKKLAAQLGVTTEALSEQDKMQARVAATLDLASRYSGIYEQSMTTAGKQVLSSTRYIEDFKVMVGETFNEALTIAVMAFTDSIKDANGELSELSKTNQLKEWGNNVTDVFAFVGDAASSAAAAFQATGAAIAWVSAKVSTGGASAVAANAEIDASFSADIDRILANTTRFRDAVEKRRAALAEADTPAAKEVSAAAETARISAAREAEAAENALAAAEKNAAAARDVAAKSAAAAASAYGSYRDKLLAYRTELEASIAGGEKASAAQKMLAELTANNTSAVTKLTKGRREELIEIAKQNVALEATAAARVAESTAIKAAMTAVTSKNEALKQEISAQTSANEQARAGASGASALAIAKLNEAAATADRTAAITLETSGNKELSDQYREQANLLRELADQKGQSVEIERAQKAAEEWKKTTDSIGQSLTDALLRGFESGAKFADVFKSTLINMFRTLVLRPIIQPIVQGAAGLVTGALGLSANASTGGGLGGLSTLSNLSTLYKAGSLLPGVQSYAFNQLGRMAVQPGIIGDVGLAGFNYAGSLAQAPGGLVGGGLLSAGAGWAGGQLGNMVFGGGGQANTGAALGGLAGSIGGSLVPVIGPIIGSAIGSFLGSGIGSLFGNNKTPKTQFTTLASDADRGGLQDYNKLLPKGRSGETFAESAFGVIGLGGKTRQVDAQDFKKTFDAIAAIDNALAAALNPDQIVRVQNALKGFTSGVNATAAEYTRDRLVLVAKTIDDTMGKIVDGFKGGVDDLASLTQALAIVQQYTSADIGSQITAMAEAAKNASASLFDTWQSSSSQLSDLANGFDGSLSKALELSTLTQSTGQMELALVSQIQQALTATHAMFGATIDQIKMSVLDTAGQYDFLRARADELDKQLSTAFDPQQITQIAGQINAITQQAYGLLDAGQKQTAAPEFIKYLNDVDALTTERLNASQDKIVATHQAMADAIESAMTRVADKMAAAAQAQSSAADKMDGAASAMLSAAGKPITINVNPLGGGGEITFA